MNLRMWILALVFVCSIANAENTNLVESTKNISTNNTESIDDSSANLMQDSQDMNTNLSELTNDSIHDLHETKVASKVSQDSQSFFSTAPILGDTFGSFAVGYQMLSKQHSLSVDNLSHGAFFALDRGWSFIDNTLLFALSLDGSAGEFYSINIGVKLGYRALLGRLIPNLAISYGLINHKINGTQHNLHGATAMLSLFVDIAQGFGLEVAYRVGLHSFPTLKNTGERANIHSFMVNIRFMDFGI